MLSKNNLTITLLLGLMLTSCANHYSQKARNSDAAQWDFDHDVQFIQTQLSHRLFQLEVIPNNKVSFERLSVFLIRKSYHLCKSYHYKLEMIQGIEGFDDKRAMPNYIFPSLIAKVECKKN